MTEEMLKGVFKMYTPLVKAPEQYKKKITDFVDDIFSRKILHLENMTNDFENDKKEITDFFIDNMHNDDLYIALRNRLENKIVEDIAKLHNEYKDTSDYNIDLKMKKFINLSDVEQITLTKAYKENPTEIIPYVFMFYSLNLYTLYYFVDYDIYKALQLSLLDYIENNNMNEENYKALCKKHFKNNMKDKYIEIISEYCGYNVSRDIMKSLIKISKIPEEDWQKYNYCQLSKKYDVSKNCLYYYQLKHGIVCLDMVSNDDADKKKEIDVSDNSNAINNVERKILLNDFAKYMSKEEKIQEENIYKILNAVLTYKEIHNARTKLSTREKIDLSQQINISYNSLNNILTTFGEWFG